MKNFLWTLYYYTYKFYTTILKDADPHTATVWAIGLATGAPIGLGIVHYTTYHHNIRFEVFLIIPIISLLIFYNYYIIEKRMEKIIKEKPYIRSPLWSKIMVLSFYVFWVSSFYWITPLFLLILK